MQQCSTKSLMTISYNFSYSIIDFVFTLFARLVRIMRIINPLHSDSSSLSLIYNEMNKNILTMPLLSNCADNASETALNALYGRNNHSNNGKKRTYSEMTVKEGKEENITNDPPLKRRKISESEEEYDCNGFKMELDALRLLQNKDIILNDKTKKDSVCKELSDSVYELFERIRSNDTIKHLIRTNLANNILKVQTIQTRSAIILHKSK